MRRLAVLAGLAALAIAAPAFAQPAVESGADPIDLLLAPPTANQPPAPQSAPTANVAPTAVAPATPPELVSTSTPPATGVTPAVASSLAAAAFAQPAAAPSPAPTPSPSGPPTQDLAAGQPPATAALAAPLPAPGPAVTLPAEASGAAGVALQGDNQTDGDEAPAPPPGPTYRPALAASAAASSGVASYAAPASSMVPGSFATAAAASSGSKGPGAPSYRTSANVAATSRPWSPSNPGLPLTRYQSVQRRTQLAETGVSADTPLNDRDLAYESRVRGAFSTAESNLGPLDGRWLLAGPGGGLFTLQLVDRGNLEGVWRDLHRPPGSVGALGLIDSLYRDGDTLTVRFTPHRGGAPVSVTLHRTPDGGWAGQATGAVNGEVSLRRN